MIDIKNQVTNNSQADAAQTVRKVISVWSPIAGAGASVSSINLARILNAKGYKTLLLDYDLKTPALAIYLNVEYRPERGLESVVPFAEASNLSPKVLESNIEISHGISVLPCNIDHNINTSPETFKNIIDCAKELYDYTIVDISGLVDIPSTYSALLSCDKCFVIVEKNAVLIQLVRYIKKFVQEQVGIDKLALVINQSAKEVTMSINDIVNFMGINSYTELPSLGYDFINAVNKGKLVETLGKDSKSKKYDELFEEFYLNQIGIFTDTKTHKLGTKKSFFTK